MAVGLWLLALLDEGSSEWQLTGALAVLRLTDYPV